MHAGIVDCRATRSSGGLAEDAFRHFHAQLFSRDCLGLAIVEHAEHQLAFLSRVEPIAGHIFPVAAKERTRGFHIVQRQGEMQERHGKGFPGFVALNRPGAELPR
jgi:hypothetical protein